LLGSYQSTLGQVARGDSQPKIYTVAPSRMLGFHSLLNFSVKQSLRLIDEGHRNAKVQLGDMFRS
jgi:hypothetical protein